MKKRRALTKLIGDLATRGGVAESRSGRAPGTPAVAGRISPRKPLARVDASERVVVPSRPLQGSPILAALAKTARAESRRRRPARDKSRRDPRPPVPTARHARRARRAS